MTQMTQPHPQMQPGHGHSPLQPRPVPVPQAPVPQQVPMPQPVAPRMAPQPMPQPVMPLDYAGAGPVGQVQAPNYAPLNEGNRDEGEKPLPSISVHAFCDRQETAHCINETTRDWRMRRTNVKIYMGGLPAAIVFVMRVRKLS